MAGNGMQIVCRSIFKNGSKTTKKQFTKKWTEMINQLEKRKLANKQKV